MSYHTKIQWADSTWNPIMGCTPVSEGCENCYARSNVARFAGKKGWPADTETVTFFPERLEQPLKWTSPRRIFVCSMSDLFHEDVPDDFIREVFWTMQRTAWHTYLILTKRPRRMANWFARNSEAPLLPNVWLGVTAETQARANERIPLLLSIPAAVHFVSIEPMLGPMMLMHLTSRHGTYNALQGCGTVASGVGEQTMPNSYGNRLDWIIVGGESGKNARPMALDWVRRIRDECAWSGTPFFFKQLRVDGEMVAMPELDGQVWDQRP